MALAQWDQSNASDPNSFDAETCMVGSMLLSGWAVRWFCTHGNPDWCWSPANQKICRAIVASYHSGARLVSTHFEPDILTVSNELTKAGELDQVGGIEFLMVLIERCVSPTNMAYYAKIVEERWRKRTLSARLAELRKRADLPEEDADLLVAEAYQLTKGIGQRSGSDVVDASDVDIEGDDTTGLPTGFKCIDRLCTYRGFPPGLNTIVAGTGAGKTRIAVQMMAHHLDPFSEHRALFISLEMTDKQIIRTHVSQQTGMFRFPEEPKTESLFAEDVAAETAKYEAKVREYRKAADELRKSPLRIWTPDVDDQTVDKIIARIEMEHMRDPLSSVWIDYMQLIKTKGKHENRTLELHDIAMAIKMLGLKLKIPIQVLCQPADKLVKSPFQMEVQHCKNVESTSEMMICLLRDKSTNEVSGCVKKNRYGREAMLDGLSFDQTHGKWVEGQDALER